jgi:predicted nucleic acid-binding protein
LQLRTLDALHLTIAKEIQTEVVATADRMMAIGAEAMGFSVVRFDKPDIR